MQARDEPGRSRASTGVASKRARRAAGTAPGTPRSARICYAMGMTDPTHTRCRFHPTPDWLVLGLLVVEGLLWLSERYRWFWFNERKG